TGGKVTTDLGGDETASGVVVRPDGKVVVAGYSFSFTTFTDDFVLAQYNANGSLDAGFGTGGKVTTDLGGDDVAFAVALQPDGKVVVAGYSLSFTTFTDDFAVARYNANGSLDTTFGTGGKVITDLGSDVFEWAYGVALQPDGKIVAAGVSLDR